MKVRVINQRSEYVNESAIGDALSHTAKVIVNGLRRAFASTLVSIIVKAGKTWSNIKSSIVSLDDYIPTNYIYDYTVRYLYNHINGSLLGIRVNSKRLTDTGCDLFLAEVAEMINDTIIEYLNTRISSKNKVLILFNPASYVGRNLADEDVIIDNKINRHYLDTVLDAITMYVLSNDQLTKMVTDWLARHKKEDHRQLHYLIED